MPKHIPIPNERTDAAMQCGLRYVGGGAARIGIPARDLAPAELGAIADAWELTLRELCAALLDSGLYVADIQTETAPVTGED